MIYFITITILAAFRTLTNELLYLNIFLLLSMVYYMVRIFLENDAMIKAKYLAKEYMQEKEEVAIETRDEREEPKRQDTTTFDFSLMNGVVLTPEDLKPAVEETPKIEEKPIIEQPKEEFEGAYYNNVPAQSEDFFQRDRTNIRREVREMPKREDFKALDDFLTSKNTSNETNFNLELDDNDDLDNKNDDFFDE